MPKQGATTEAPETPATEATTAAERPVKDIVREMWNGGHGKSRSEIAKALGITYQRVFSLTKGESHAGSEGNSSGARPKVILEGLEGPMAEWNGKPRIEAIRELYTNGGVNAKGEAFPARKVGDVARAISTAEKPVAYQIVFQATRSIREDGQAEAEGADAAEDEVEEGAVGETEDTTEEDEEEA